MPDNSVLQFKDDIRPFDGVFDQLWVACAAVSLENKWVSIYTSLTLRNAADAGVFEPRIVKLSELIALMVPYGIDALDSLLAELRDGTISPRFEGERYQIFLNRVAAGMNGQTMTVARPQFNNPWRPLRQFAPNDLAWRPTIELNAPGDRFYELLLPEADIRISKHLRAHQPPYHSLDGLMQVIGCRYRPSGSDQAQVQVRAVLPFHTTIRDEHVYVESPSVLAADLSVLLFFSPSESLVLPYTEQSPLANKPNCSSVPFHFQWPTSASQAEAHVRYKGEEFEMLNIRHWAEGANWRATADSCFDPGSKLLKEALRANGQGKENQRSELFELAIVRLLTLGGIATTWHGALRHSSKPDLAAYLETPTRRIVLLGECTLEKPGVKLSPLKTRIADLQGSAGTEADLLGVVFTPCDPVEADYSEAAQAGIALVGRNEIAALLELVERNAGSSALVKQIENVIAVHNAIAVDRWEKRY